MNLRKIALATALGAAIGIAGFATQPETGHAAYYYWTKTKNYSPAKPYHQKAQKTTAYLWSAHHQYRVHNMKNYPGHTWNVSQSVKMRGAIYYRVSTQYGAKTVSGYVWRGYVTAGTFAVGNDVIFPSYTYSSKGIYYSTVPYAATYGGKSVTGYDPSTFLTNGEYEAISTSVVNSFTPEMSTDQINEVVAYVTKNNPRKMFRIAKVPFSTSDGTTMVPVVQDFTEPYTDTDDMNHAGQWQTEAPVFDILALAENGRGSKVGSLLDGSLSNYSLIGPRYAFPNDNAAVLDRNLSDIEVSESIIKTVGNYVMIGEPYTNKISFVKASDLVKWESASPQTVNGLSYVPYVISQPQNVTSVVNTSEGNNLAAQGFKSMRSIFLDMMEEHTLKDGVWQETAHATIDGESNDGRTVRYWVTVGENAKPQLVKTAKLNQGTTNDFRSFLTQPTASFATLLK